MYADGTYLTSYSRDYIKREKRIKAGRRVLAAAMAVCIAGATVFSAVRLSLGDALMTESPITKSSVIIKNESASYAVLHNTISEGVSFENLIYKNVTDAVALVEEAKPPIVFIDAGHGGEDGGCESGKVLEKNVNLDIAKHVKTRLENQGYKVIMSREDDTYISKEARVEAANKAKADIYVSIHQNFSKYSKVKGMEVWYDGTDANRDNERLAQLIKQQTIITTASVERELRNNADFYVTVNTDMPTCLIETGFLSNSIERKNLTDEGYQEKIADGIANGIECFFHP